MATPSSVQATVKAPLDPGFQPAVLFNRHYEETARASGQAVPLVLGLEREGGLISRFETVVRPGGDAETLRYVERIVKFLMWARGGWNLHFGGPKDIGEFIRKTYSARGARKFDCEMAALAYGRKFEVLLTTADKVPAAKDTQIASGGHLKGCRIGFDLGASDYKVSAVIDGEVVFTNPHFPALRSDPMALSGASRRKQIPSSGTTAVTSGIKLETEAGLSAWSSAAVASRAIRKRISL